MFLEDQGLLKTLTRLVEEAHGSAYPEVILRLKRAWNNDDSQLHAEAWAALKELGTFNRDFLMSKAKELCRANDCVTRKVAKSK
jgi:hypothetical protein